MPPASRRYHTKSKTGCIQCKSLRKKCDEQLPRCGQCQKRGTRCEFESRRPSEAVAIKTEPRAVKTELSSLAEYNQSICLRCSGTLDPSFTLPMQELELMYMFATSTTQTQVALSHQDFASLWTVYCPQEGTNHTFVMHAILASAATHKAYMQPSAADKWTRVTHMYKSKALACFNSEVTHINGDNSVAVLYFASLLILVAFAAPCANGTGPPDPIAGFCEIQSNVRGHWNLQPTLVRHTHTSTTPGRYLRGDIPPMPDVPSTQPSYTPGGLAAIRRVSEAVVASKISQSDKQTYANAIKILRAAQKRDASRPVSFDTIFYWPMFIHDDFLQLLNTRQPFALVILAHWAAPFYTHGNDVWFLHSWSQILIQYVTSFIPLDLGHLMEWPLLQIGQPFALSTNTGNSGVKSALPPQGRTGHSLSPLCLGEAKMEDAALAHTSQRVVSSITVPVIIAQQEFTSEQELSPVDEDEVWYAWGVNPSNTSARSLKESPS